VFDSGTIIRELASYIQGGGGGQAFFATAGGKKPAGIQEALNQARVLLSQS
jgi:alanyl-tRNA synthetase